MDNEELVLSAMLLPADAALLKEDLTDMIEKIRRAANEFDRSPNETLQNTDVLCIVPAGDSTQRERCENAVIAKHDVSDGESGVLHGAIVVPRVVGQEEK